ncbi:MAG: TRAP transporter large permease subunit [Zoogloeaceae bacterium]|nr:TRAP transporter large permease subunit [Zoogloeaceae bacterium]
MSEYIDSRRAQAAPPGVRPVVGSRLLDVRHLTSVTGALGALMVAVLLLIVAYEVISRYFFNEPTYWVTEISTYLVVGIVFLSLGLAYRRKEHIRIEFAVDMLPEKLRQPVMRFAEWLGVFFVASSVWQMVRFVVSEYTIDSRSWGLLSIQLWIPQSLVLIGMAVLLIAMLNRMDRHSAGLNRAAQWISHSSVVLGCVLAIAIGNHSLEIAGVRISSGLVLIAGACVVSAGLHHGRRMALSLTLVLASSALAYAATSGGDSLQVGLLLLCTLVVLLGLGMEVGLGLGLTGLLGLAFLLPTPQLSAVADRLWNGANSFTYSAVPMFILMGSILMRSGITVGLFNALTAWTGRLPGGLAHATIGAGGIFAAFSGSSIATAATIGKTAGQEMIARGYSPRMTMGAIAGGGTLGILIPPSIPLIIYGAAVGAPVTLLFAAAVIPGLVVLFSMMLMVLAWSVLVPGSAGETRRYSWSEKRAALIPVVPFVILIVSVFSVLYLGIATPTEAGAVGAAISALIVAQRRQLTWTMITESLAETAVLTSCVMIIVIGSGVFGWVVDYSRVPQMLVELVKAQDLAPWMLMVGIVGVYVVLGMFIDPISMILMTVSITFPIVVLAGYDAIWFGVALMLVAEIGLITPPVGIILFVLRGINSTVPFRDIVMGAFPFVILLLLNLLLIAILPEIVHWLPNKMQ